MAGNAVTKSGKAATTRSRPTRELLIDTVIAMMESKSPEDLRIEEVLSTSGVSSGSLYHHFRDFSDLIDQSIIARYAQDVELGLALLEEIAASADDVESVTAGIRRATERALGSDRESARFNRSQVMARAASNAGFRDALVPHQDRLNRAWVALFRDLQAKGLVQPDIDPMAGAMFVQAYSLGFVVNDVSGHPVADARLVDIIMRVLTQSFITPG